MKTFIFRCQTPNAHGLGDSLMSSRVPRLAKENGYDKVYVSNVSGFRNQETYDLVFGENPYVDGLVNEYPLNGWFRENTEGQKTNKNLIDQIQSFYGFGDVVNSTPKLYYKPTLIPELKDKTIFEPNHLTDNNLMTPDSIFNYFKTNDIQIDYNIILINDNGFSSNRIQKPDAPNYEILSLKHLVDVVYSCKHFYGLHSGMSHVASAYDKPATIFYGTHPSQINWRRQWCMPNIKYENLYGQK